MLDVFMTIIVSQALNHVGTKVAMSEDTKGVFRIRISKTNRQHNGQKEKHKRTNNDLQNIHIKQKIE